MSAIVVNWNTSALLRECLAALTAADQTVVPRVICIDNGSTDGSPAVVRDQFPSVTLIGNANNRGFAAACNQGITLALERQDAEYVALVNSDVVVGPSTIGDLVAELAGAPEVAAIGPALRLPDGRPQTGAAGFAPTAWSGICQFLFLSALTGGRLAGFLIEHGRFAGESRPVPVTWVSGACMVVRADAIRRVGRLDERLFMYGEDVDWGARMGRAGLTVWYAPHVEVRHHHGASGTGASPRWLASACELVRRDRGRTEYVAFRAAAALGLGARRIAYQLAYLTSRREHYRKLARDMGVYAWWAIGRG